MKWEDYHKIYWTYELSVNQTKILNFYGHKIFTDFPKGLPEIIKGQWVNDQKFLVEMCTKLLPYIDNKSLDEASKNLDFNVGDTTLKNPEIFMNQVAVYKSFMTLGVKFDANINFQRLLFSQELVMMLAHLDAFLSDSLRAICRVRPEILKSNKKIDWSTLIDFGNWDKIEEYLIEDFTFDFGWGTFKNKIEFLNNKIGLNIVIPDSELGILDEAENIRNIIVHNGGRISQEYINRTKKDDLNVGDLIPITPEFIEEVSSIILLLAWDIFALISNKFFDIGNSQLIWRGREPPP